MFDLYRLHTHTKIQFGDKGYWVEWGTDCLPYGSILTEILNCSITDYCAKLSAVEQAVAAQDQKQLSERLEALAEKLAKKPKTEKTAQQLRQDAEHFRTGAVPGGLDRYLAAVYPEVCTGVDYLPKDAVVFLCESGRVDERV